MTAAAGQRREPPIDDVVAAVAAVGPAEGQADVRGIPFGPQPHQDRGDAGDPAASAGGGAGRAAGPVPRWPASRGQGQPPGRGSRQPPRRLPPQPPPR